MTWLDRNILRMQPIALCLDERSYLKKMGSFGVAPSDAPRWVSHGADASTHTVDHHGAHASIVCIEVDPKSSREQHYCLLVHEAVHVWQEYKRSIGEIAPGDEVEAHSIQAIAQRLMIEFRARTAKVRFAR